MGLVVGAIIFGVGGVIRSMGLDIVGTALQFSGLLSGFLFAVGGISAWCNRGFNRPEPPVTLSTNDVRKD
jgi:hypothetical protein